MFLLTFRAGSSAEKKQLEPLKPGVSAIADLALCPISAGTQNDVEIAPNLNLKNPFWLLLNAMTLLAASHVPASTAALKPTRVEGRGISPLLWHHSCDADRTIMCSVVSFGLMMSTAPCLHQHTIRNTGS